MHLSSFPSLFPRFYNPCLHVLQTCRNYKMYSWELFDTFASWDNDKDHVHVFYISHTMVLLWVRDLEFLLPSIVKMLGTHSYDVLVFYIMYTRQLPSSPYLCSDSTEMFRFFRSSLISSTTGSVCLYLILLQLQGFLQSLSLSLELLFPQWILKMWK
jgi:hypothetical protein